MKYFATAVASMFLFAPSLQAKSLSCPPAETAEAEVEQTIRDFFDTLRGEGELAFEDVTTPTMYSFDVGQRFEGRELADLIIEALEEGVEINWTLGPMDTEVACKVAWAQWENTGSAGTPPDVRPVRWLESAVLVHEDGRWKIDFFHSQRARGS
ncbi:MAG: hypothetical protein AAGI28_03215 [Pseudomonadota bacterium]